MNVTMTKKTRTSISIPDELYDLIQNSATKNRRSIAQEIIVLIEKGLQVKDTE